MHEPVQFNFQRQKCLELNYTQSLLYKFNLRMYLFPSCMTFDHSKAMLSVYNTSAIALKNCSLVRLQSSTAQCSPNIPAAAKPARQFSHAMRIFLCL